MTPRCIVVGVDFTEPSVIAARWTVAHLGDDSEIVLAHAICVPEPPRFLRGLHAPTQPLIEDAKRGAEVRLRELISSLGVNRVRHVIRVGRPDEVVIAIARELGAELVVIGPHRERPGIWKLLGGTAERVTQRAPFSVLLARALPAGAPRTVLAAIDESEITPAVLDWAALISSRTNANVIVMHIVNPLISGAVAMNAGSIERRRAEDQLREGSETWLRERIAGTRLEGAVTEVAFGDPGFEILAAVERFGADLVVIGRNSPGRGRTAGLGGTSAFLLRSGSGPVLLVSSPGAAGD